MERVGYEEKIMVEEEVMRYQSKLLRSIHPSYARHIIHHDYLKVVWCAVGRNGGNNDVVIASGLFVDTWVEK